MVYVKVRGLYNKPVVYHHTHGISDAVVDAILNASLDAHQLRSNRRVL